MRKLWLFHDRNLIFQHDRSEKSYRFRFTESVMIVKIVVVERKKKKENLLPIQERAPPLNGQKASRGQSSKNRSGLKASGSSQYRADKKGIDRKFYVKHRSARLWCKPPKFSIIGVPSGTGIVFFSPWLLVMVKVVSVPAIFGICAA